MKLKTSRMEALTDGIFAIVMTIMIVGLSEILTFRGALKNEDFYKLFLSLTDDFLSYIISFLILGGLWFDHHWQFHYIKNIDPVLVFINIIWFMFICTIPFSTALLGDYPNFFAPGIAFEINILIVFLILHIHWVYATHKNHIVDASLDRKIVSRHKNIGLILIIVVLFEIALTSFRHFFK